MSLRFIVGLAAGGLCTACSCGEDEAKQSPPGDAIQIVVSVGNPDARSCDVLLEERGPTRVERAEFAEAVLGQLQTRSPLAAVSFLNRSNGAFDAEVATLVVYRADGEEPLLVRAATCYDAQGNPLRESGVTIHSAGG